MLAIQRSVKVLGAISLFFLIGGCSPGASSNGPSSPKLRTNSVGDLEGQWLSNCSDAVMFGNSQRKNLMVSGSSAERLTVVSASGDCGDTTVEIRESADLVVGKPLSDGVNEFDILVHRISVKPKNQTGIDILNSGAGFCGFKDWKIDVEKDLTKKTGPAHCYPKLPKSFFDIFSIEGDRLYFGEGEAVTDISIRAASINRDEYYTKR